MPAGGGRPKVQLSEVSVAFSGHGGPVLALDRIDLAVEPGEFLCLVGPSGCGKSTLLRVVAELVAPDGGQVDVRAPTDIPGSSAHRHGVPGTCAAPVAHGPGEFVAFGPEIAGSRAQSVTLAGAA